MLMELKQVLQRQGVVNLFDITQSFGISADTARELLAVWQRKGKVEKINETSCGSRCAKCSPRLVEEYRWVDGISDLSDSSILNNAKSA